jgi:hypothetical protein
VSENKTSIIGLNNWDATGESILSVVSRLAFLNNFTWSEVKKVFVESRVISNSTADATHQSGLLLEYINKLFSDPEKQRCKSFLNYYYPKSVLSPERITYLYSNQIRICPSCAAIGKHLLAHQLSYYDKCPIHKVKLTQTCVQCSSELGRFELRKPSDVLPCYGNFVCSNCGHQNLNLGNSVDSDDFIDLTKKIKQYLISFSIWLEEINYFYEKFHWLNLSKERNPVLLISSSRRISKNKSCCLTEINGYKKKQFIIHTDINKRKGLYSNQEVNYFLTILIEKAMSQLKYLKRRFKITSGQIQNATLLSKFDTIICGDEYSIWAEAFEDLSRLFNNPRSKDTLYKILDDKGEIGVFIVEIWKDSFGKRFLHNSDCDIETILRISILWIRYFIQEHFYALVYSKSLSALNIPSDSLGINKYRSFTCAFEWTTNVVMLDIWSSEIIKQQLITLFDEGFMGYSLKLSDQYKFYKKLAVFECSKSEILAKDKYIESLQTKEIVELSKQEDECIYVNVKNLRINTRMQMMLRWGDNRSLLNRMSSQELM